MAEYYYRTETPAVLVAIIAWENKQAAFHNQRAKLAQVFGGDASPMYSGNDKYVGGIKLSASRDLDVHWCRPDQYGYRALRSLAKPEKGLPKEERVTYKTEHDRLTALWKEHCPARISMDDTWKAIGLNWGSIWLNGGVFFELDGVAYFHLGFQLRSDGEQIEGAEELISSEYQAARRSKLEKIKAMA